MPDDTIRHEPRRTESIDSEINDDSDDPDHHVPVQEQLNEAQRSLDEDGDGGGE
jgi:hypothetical protein